MTSGQAMHKPQTLAKADKLHRGSLPCRKTYSRLKEANFKKVGPRWLQSGKQVCFPAGDSSGICVSGPGALAEIGEAQVLQYLCDPGESLLAYSFPTQAGIGCLGKASPAKSATQGQLSVFQCVCGNLSAGHSAFCLRSASLEFDSWAWMLWHFGWLLEESVGDFSAV